MLIGNSNDAAGELFDESLVPKPAGGSVTSFSLELERKLAVDWPAAQWRDTHVVLAVSGGADSIALLRAIVAIKAMTGGGGAIYAGHLNHGLRGAEGDSDEAWLKDLCCQVGIPFESANVDVASLAAEQGDGIEAAARQARYDFLRQTAERLGARFVVTAHTADDQAETVLHRILRGTGLAGLAGISRFRPLSSSVTLVRPMLATWRSDVVEYLRQLGQSYRSDASNDDTRYTRNRLRHELLPLIRQHFNSKADGALVQLAIQARDAQQVIESIAGKVANECVIVEYTGDGAARFGRHLEIDCTRLANEPPVVVREVLKSAWIAANWPLQSMGFSQWQLLADLAGENCHHSVANLPSNIQVRREGPLLRFAPLGLA
jgi:tRNA(Ile)-lysidine synthase